MANVCLADSQLTPKSKLRQEFRLLKELSKNEKMHLEEGEVYKPGAFKIYIWITKVFVFKKLCFIHVHDVTIKIFHKVINFY